MAELAGQRGGLPVRAGLSSAPDAAAAGAASGWPRVRHAFDRLADLHPLEREAALAALTDPAVAAEVRALLAHHDADNAGLLAQPAASAWGDAARRETEEDRCGQRLGAWRIVSRLGSGGMGEVWLARRDDGAFQGEAAVKVLRGAWTPPRCLRASHRSGRRWPSWRTRTSPGCWMPGAPLTGCPTS